MQSVYYLNTEEINIDFINSVKSLFSGKNIEITINEMIDETDYLLKSKKNAQRLLKSVDNINKGKNLEEIDIEFLKRQIDEKIIVWAVCSRRYVFLDFKWFENSKKRIFDLIENIQQSSFSGIGKPEPLKYKLKGFWSRRITDEHRLIYKVTDEAVLIASCRYHYE